VGGGGGSGDQAGIVEAGSRWGEGGDRQLGGNLKNQGSGGWMWVEGRAGGGTVSSQT
jgi:hypothetical protein